MLNFYPLGLVQWTNPQLCPIHAPYFPGVGEWGCTLTSYIIYTYNYYIYMLRQFCLADHYPCECIPPCKKRIPNSQLPSPLKLFFLHISTLVQRFKYFMDSCTSKHCSSNPEYWFLYQKSLFKIKNRTSQILCTCSSQYVLTVLTSCTFANFRTICLEVEILTWQAQSRKQLVFWLLCCLLP